jgi:hypothetical protein
MGTAATTKDVDDLADHETAWRTLARLVENGMVGRLLHRVNNFPSFTTLLGASTGSAPDPFARAIAGACL